MGTPGEAGGEGQSQVEVLLREIEENTAILMASIQRTGPAESDPWGCSKLEVRRKGLRFGQARPTFHWHRNRWDNFAAWF